MSKVRYPRGGRKPGKNKLLVQKGRNGSACFAKWPAGMRPMAFFRDRGAMMSGSQTAGVAGRMDFSRKKGRVDVDETSKRKNGKEQKPTLNSRGSDFAHKSAGKVAIIADRAKSGKICRKTNLEGPNWRHRDCTALFGSYQGVNKKVKEKGERHLFLLVLERVYIVEACEMNSERGRLW